VPTRSRRCALWHPPLCRLIHDADPETTTLEWDVARRAGKVFLDVNLNRKAASFASAYSVRARWGAPVSAPFSWDELGDVQPDAFTIETMPARIAEVDDVFRPLVEGPGASLREAMGILGIS